MAQSICIFTPLGKTFTFHDTNITVDNETVLVFSYKAMSDGLKKIHVAMKPNIVGYSLTWG